MRMEDIKAMYMASREFAQAVKDKAGAEFECWDWFEVLGLEKERTPDK
jgi:hypothetical protein